MADEKPAPYVFVKTTALEAVNFVREDMRLLESGDWQPDKESIGATLGMLDIIELELLQRKENTHDITSD